MFKYILKFSKEGNVCYISHLDLMRLFYRAIKRSGIRLGYSKGFNPHPKISFAQPLSLGYIGLNELMEMETEEEYEADIIRQQLAELMPEGLKIKECVRVEEGGKTLAARTVAARYLIEIPLQEGPGIPVEEMGRTYMSQERILAMKKQKKKKELLEVDIRPMIRDISFSSNGVSGGQALIIEAVLDSGSVSNLSPELLMDTVRKRFGLVYDRNEADVTRAEIYFR